MPDDLILIGEGGDDFKLIPVGRCGSPFVRWLTAAARIETGLVESEHIPLNSKNLGIRLKAVGVLQVKAGSGFHIGLF